jgi:uncharacterized protein
MMTRRQFFASSVSALALPSFVHARSPEKTLLEQVRAGERLQGVDVIDTHAHFEEISSGLIWPLSVEMLVADMKRCGVGQAIVSPFRGFMATSGDQLKAAHDACVEAVAKNRKSLRAYLVFHPHLLETSKAEMKRILEPDSPFVGFKLHGGIHQYPPDGPNYRPLYEFANEHALHVLHHVDESAGTVRVGPIMKEYPRMTMALAHIGFLPTETAALLKEHPNLFVDTCGSTLPYHYLEWFVRQAGAEKFLFATDCTYLCIGSQIAKVAFARISEKEKGLLFGGNARRIFGDRLVPPSQERVAKLIPSLQGAPAQIERARHTGAFGNPGFARA